MRIEQQSQEAIGECSSAANRQTQPVRRRANVQLQLNFAEANDQWAAFGYLK
jgi:hypothetical protein